MAATSTTPSSRCSYKMFKYFNRKFKLGEVEPPSDVKDSFLRYSGGAPLLSPDQFRLFLADHQGHSEVDLADAERAIDQVLHKKSQLPGGTAGMDLDCFFHYLLRDDLNGPVLSQVHHDMTAPLSNYFIYTGHNSYLTGNQLSSDCSDAPIIKALQRGVRVIELDIWPNSTKDDIHVLHGRTLTTPVLLIKCLKSIKEYAFVKSPYPVIITLEDHLKPDLQAKVADMLTEIFGDMLYYPTTESLAEFPSPESLKNRIIISTKPPKEYLESKDKGTVSPNGKDSSGDDPLLKDSSGTGSPPLESYLKLTDSDEDSEEQCEGDSNACRASAPEYKRLITIQAGKPKGQLKEALQVFMDKVRRLSMSEQQLEKATQSHGVDIVRFTQRNILRVYPKGTRVTSSNYDPHVGWMHGAQMVAFNMQGYGKSLWIMHGMFKANGGCGYVKKPDFLINQGPNKEVFDPRREQTIKRTLKVKVYMGDGWNLDFSTTHFDTYSPPDFYTKIRIVGVPADVAKKKTRIIKDDWFPVWDEEFTFPLTVPELALVRIEVREYDRSEKDDFGGQTCLPVSEIQPGFRAVPLYDKKGEKYKSVKLLMRFQFV
ncbi:hypothetical protein MLD38_011109 [Melastoma candidum]|uniref:Uncharacterized protein n=1 Tax=Melastoma candidum TaxID=119954 RepID=A0ACB9R241_9MYRT|nr:hypothetical protein MLD38_011109 [Melastoma candidum]